MPPKPGTYDIVATVNSVKLYLEAVATGGSTDFEIQVADKPSANTKWAIYVSPDGTAKSLVKVAQKESYLLTSTSAHDIVGRTAQTPSTPQTWTFVSLPTNNTFQITQTDGSTTYYLKSPTRAGNYVTLDDQSSEDFDISWRLIPRPAPSAFLTDTVTQAEQPKTV